MWALLIYDSYVVIHDFDRRHNITKDKGKSSLQISLQMLRNDELLEMEDPPPTFRALDERRRAQFSELLFTMGRIQIFHRKIDNLRDERLILLNERAQLVEDLKCLHESSFRLDNEMARLERDLNRCYELLNTKHAVLSIYDEARKVLERAKKEKRSAEARFAGKWDDVKDAADALDFVHDDTRALLRHKFLCDLKLRTQSDEVERLHDVIAETRHIYESTEARTDFLLYCRPGNMVLTRYGEGLIRGYRDRDHMLLVSLSFGRPPAKLWIKGDELVWSSKARQQAERLLMAREDEAMQDFCNEEKIIIKRELFAMRLEDTMTRQSSLEFRQANKLSAAVESNIRVAILKGEKLLKAQRYKTLLDGKIDEAVKERYEKLMLEYRTYDGPPSGAPKKPTMLSMYKIRQDMNMELRERFLSAIATNAERATLQQFYQNHLAQVEENAIHAVINDSITGMILNIAEESIREGKAAKVAAERASGLIIPHPVWMQFDIYSSLIELKKRRRSEIREELLLVKGALAKVDAHRRNHPDPIVQSTLPADSDELPEEELNRKLELDRQRQLCNEMDSEEAQCRKFYRWELLENLRERRAMREEENLMRDILKEEAAIAAAQDKSYAVTSTMMEEQQKQYKLTSFDKRRLELKALTLERGKQAEETAYMTIEDARSKILRDLDKAERMRRQYEKEFGIVDDPEPVEDVPQEQEMQSVDVMQFETVRVPTWMNVPEGWENWLLSQQKDYVKRAKSVRALTKRINRALLVEEKRMQKFQQKNLLFWEELYLEASLKKLESELRFMDLERILQVSNTMNLLVT